MNEYLVYYVDERTGAKSEIDIIYANDDYTPEKYREDSEKNGVEWGTSEIYFLKL